MNPEYTKGYECAREMVNVFIDSEEQVNTKDISSMYDQTSWLVNFFNFNLSQIMMGKQVEDSIDSMMDIGDGEQKPYKAALARVRLLYINMTMALGSKFMMELEENCIKSIMFITDKDRNERGNPYKTTKRIFSKHPEMVISAIGNPYFSEKLIKFTHTNQTRS